MASTSTFFLLSLAILSCTPLAVDASSQDQEAQLSKFMASRVGPLPGRCKATPPSDSKEEDRIAGGLPGQPPGVDFRQYAGYVTLDEERGRELFYYLVESPHDAASKPLILWLTGGPGCSSLSYGAMMELGPFRVNPDGETLSRNEHAWNNLANVMFLDSPAGVGFSVSKVEADYKTVHDGNTADDTYKFLVRWLERFPEYKGREFFVTGESYGGHYVPQLAAVIALMNRRIAAHRTPINLRGIFLGNPLLDNDLFKKGYMEYLWSHGVISDEVWDDILSDGSFEIPDDYKYSVGDHTIGGTTMDSFDIYAPVCLQSRNNGTYYSSSFLPGYDPCSEHYVQAYLNNPEVQKALHARNGTWSACIPNLTRIDSPAFMVPTIRYLVDIGLRVWIFSGDFDAICSLTVTRYSVKDLNLDVTRKWRPWYAPNGEVGGYVQQYQGGFTLASVRAAGHMVPASQPERSLALLDAFLKNVLPSAEMPQLNN
ncbi:unnamed protein product [Urochloa humidicola]